MAIILDILVVAVFALSIFLGWKRGFIKSMTGLLAFAVAIGVALWLSAPIAQWVYDGTVEPAVSAALEGVQDDATQSVIASSDALLVDLPDGVRTLLTAAGIENGETLAGKLSPDSTGSLAERLLTDVIEPVVVGAIRMIALLVLFLLTGFLVSLLLKVVDKVFKLPLLKGINRTLGIIPGIINGVLGVLIVITLFHLLSVLGVLITPDALENTFIVSRLSDINPFVFKIG